MEIKTMTLIWETSLETSHAIYITEENSLPKEKVIFFYDNYSIRTCINFGTEFVVFANVQQKLH